MAKIALIGDLHGHWNDWDNLYLDSRDYDYVLFVGDLGRGGQSEQLAVVRRIAALRAPTIVMPGNNDAEHLPQIAATLAEQTGERLQLLPRGREPVSGGVPCEGYAVHSLTSSAGEVGLITARPCSMGGPDISFPGLIQQLYQIRTMEESAQRLMKLVDEAPQEALLFMGHNGPEGLGAGADGLWSRDFPAPGRDGEAPGDWGDPDLRRAVDHARKQNKRVLGVIGGHMHRRSRQDQRRLSAERVGVSHFNPAVVPRIRIEGSTEWHYFVEGTLSPTGLDVEERWVDVRAELR